MQPAPVEEQTPLKLSLCSPPLSLSLFLSFFLCISNYILSSSFSFSVSIIASRRRLNPIGSHPTTTSSFSSSSSSSFTVVSGNTACSLNDELPRSVSDLIYLALAPPPPVRRSLSSRVELCFESPSASPLPPPPRFERASLCQTPFLTDCILTPPQSWRRSVIPIVGFNEYRLASDGGERRRASLDSARTGF